MHLSTECMYVCMYDALIIYAWRLFLDAPCPEMCVLGAVGCCMYFVHVRLAAIFMYNCSVCHMYMGFLELYIASVLQFVLYVCICASLFCVNTYCIYEPARV
jgi:hypothetical protein